MGKLLDKIKMEDEKLGLELEESHGDLNKIKVGAVPCVIEHRLA
jgi:hypothetical protein